MNKLDKNIIVTETGEKYQKPNMVTNIGAGLVAYIGGSQAMRPINSIGQKIALNGLSMPDINVTEDIFENAIKSSSLDKAGVKIVNVNSENADAIAESLNSTLPNFIKKNKVLSKLFERINQGNVTATLNGENAFYDPATKNIILNKDKARWTFFHEAGHALNANSGFTKMLQKCRGASALALIPMIVAVCKRKKVEGEKPKGVFDKITTFIKNNCGKLSFLAFVPMLAEEGLASIKGIKLAKQQGLSNDAIKVLTKKYASALCSYGGLAFAVSFAVLAMSKIKDVLTKPKKIEQKENEYVYGEYLKGLPRENQCTCHQG